MTKENSEGSILDGICIAMPCSVDWNEMKGDNKVRLCGGCNKNVYNISAMSKDEAEELLSAPTLPCIQVARSDSGVIITDEKPNAIRWFFFYGKSAVTAILSLVATLFPQWAAAADDKVRPMMLRGRPAVVTPQTKQQVTPALPGMPIYIPKTQNAASFWPASISGLGFATEDLPLTASEKFTPEQFKTIDSKRVSLKSVPPQLDQTAWELFFKGRKLHLKAAMHLVNKEIEEATRDCQESKKLYKLALEQIARGRHDDAFAALVYGEQNKLAQMEEQASKCKKNAPNQK